MRMCGRTLLQDLASPSLRPDYAVVPRYRSSGMRGLSLGASWHEKCITRFVQTVYMDHKGRLLPALHPIVNLPIVDRQKGAVRRRGWSFSSMVSFAPECWMRLNKLCQYLRYVEGIGRLFFVREDS